MIRIVIKVSLSRCLFLALLGLALLSQVGCVSALVRLNVHKPALAVAYSIELCSRGTAMSCAFHAYGLLVSV
jgi:hypothetical protein